MKLHRIACLNLNSLYGEQSVDLDSDLGSPSLFLVVGPTGAGKTTLLDAVCLALYGQTPRLNSERGKADKAPWRVMSHGTWRCRATVEFSKLEDGRRVRYQAEWSCERTRKKATGNPKDPERSLHRLEGGAWKQLVSSNKLKVFRPEFERVLEGMTVDEFKRAILLAQGQFAAFLRASEDARAAILERLTRTGQYRDIGARAADRKRKADHAVTLAEATLEGAKLLLDEERSALEEEIAGLEPGLVDAEAALVVAGRRWDWLRRNIELAAKARVADEGLKGSMEAEAAARPEFKRLERHRASQPAADADERGIAAQAAAKAATELAGKLEALAAAAKEAETTAKGTVSKAEERLGASIARSERTREPLSLALSASLNAESLGKQAIAARTASGLKRACAGEAEQLAKTAEAAIAGLVEAAEDAARRLADVEDRIDLAAALPGLKSDHRALIASTAEADRRANEADAASRQEAARREANQSLDRSATHAEAAAKAADGNQELLTRSLLSAATEAKAELPGEPEAAAEQAKVTLEASLEVVRQRIDGFQWRLHLAQHRGKLGDEACPLCGSLDHPSAESAAAHALDAEIQADAAGLREEAAAIEGALDRLSARASAWREAAQRALTLRREAGSARIRADDAAEVARDSADRRDKAATAREQAASARDGLEVALLASLGGLGIEVARSADGPDFDAALEAAAASAEAWTRARTVAAKADEALTAARPQAEGLRAAADRAEAAAADREADRDARNGEADAAGREASRTLAAAIEAAASGDTSFSIGSSPAQLAEALRADQADAQRAHDAAATTAARTSADAAAARALYDDAHSRVGPAVDAARAAEATRVAALTAANLPDRAALLAVRLSAADDERIATQRAALTRRIELATQDAATRQDELDGHEAVRPLDLPEDAVLPGLELARDAAQTQRDTLRDARTAKQTLLDEDDRRRADHAEGQAELARLQVDADLWDRLHRLIGVGNGDAFKRFAQILNLRELVDRANGQLATLSTRYRLTTAPPDDKGRLRLDFAVVDRQQADQVRPITTLSGGESFLISLGLALALAQFRAVRMPIETLLLDEGFGTLDQASLDVALNALSQLQSSGTQVGIISHVEALKEKVPAQVHVIPGPDGRSTVRVGAGN